MTKQPTVSPLSMLDLTVNAARIIRERGDRALYAEIMRNQARAALASANKSGDKFRKAAAMRAINYYSREAYKARATV